MGLKKTNKQINKDTVLQEHCVTICFDTQIPRTQSLELTRAC